MNRPERGPNVAGPVSPDVRGVMMPGREHGAHDAHA